MSPADACAAPLTLTGANVLDPATGEVLEGAAVAFAGGRVAHVGRDVPARGHVIDVGGAFVVPGLIEMHAHVHSIAAARRALARGVTTIRSAWTANYQDVALRAVGEAGLVRVPRVLATGVPVKEDTDFAPLADPRLARYAGRPRAARTIEALLHVARVNLDRGADHLKTFSTQRAGVAEQDPCEPMHTEEQLRAIVAEARRHGTYVMCHAQGAGGAHNAVAAGVRTLEHGTYLEERTLELMAARGTYLVPTSSWVFKLAKGRPDADPRLTERGRDMVAALRRTVPAARDHGISITAGTDGHYLADDDLGIAGEVAHLVELGLSPLEAIRAATVTAAAALRRSKQLGRLLPGHAADAIVVAGDPLADVSVLATPRLVVAAGWPFRPGDGSAA